MITDRQTRLLRQKRMEGKTQETAAAKAGMSVRSARKWQPGFLPKRGNQAQHVDPQTLLAHHNALGRPLGYPTPSAERVCAGDVSGLGDLHWHLGQINHFPSGCVQPPDRWVLQSGHSTTACSTRSMIFCCRTMMAFRTSQSAAVRSISLSMPDT